VSDSTASETSGAPDGALRADALRVIESWATSTASDNPIVTSVERDADVDRWFVRVRGEQKLVTTVWFTVRERTLHFESYFLPTPEENSSGFYEYLLRANARLYTMRFSVGLEDASYLTGIVPLAAVVAGGVDELDRVLGSVYAASEDCFPTAARIGFPARFR
jgi:hypothetical protein